MDSISLPALLNSAKEALEMQLDEEEVTRALFDCFGDKALRLDSMTMASLQANWDIVRRDVLNTFSTFYTNEKFVASLTVAFIRLIPKKANAHNIKDYHLISLVGCMYKLLSNVFDLRLRGVIGSLISEN